MGCIAPNCGVHPTVGSVFCGEHAAAPSGQRGGWLSAHRRRLAMVNPPQEAAPVALDASNIAPRLWMGGRPPFDRDLPKVDVLVLCARELQPAQTAFHGLIYRCPLIDDHLELDAITRALMCAHAVAQLLVKKKSVLVTCSQGRNRSGLVVGFALGYLTRMTADQIVEHIRNRRKTSGVLSNEAFVGYLRKYVDGKRPKKQG